MKTLVAFFNNFAVYGFSLLLMIGVLFLIPGEPDYTSYFAGAFSILLTDVIFYVLERRK